MRVKMIVFDITNVPKNKTIVCKSLISKTHKKCIEDTSLWSLIKHTTGFLDVGTKACTHARVCHTHTNTKIIIVLFYYKNICKFMLI